MRNLGGVMSLDEARCNVSVEERRADIIRSAARGQGPTFIAAKLDMLIERVRRDTGSELLAALRKVPLFGPTEDNLGWRCAGCGNVSGINPDGSDRQEECAPDCYVPQVEAAIANAEGS